MVSNIRTIPKKIYDTGINISVETSLGDLADAIIKRHMGKDMLMIITTRMFNDVCASISSEESDRFYQKDFVDKLRINQMKLEAILNILDEMHF